MKRTICIFVMFMGMFLVACGKKKEFTGVQEGLRYVEMYQTTTFSPEGVFFRGNDDMLYFRPAGSEEKIIFCYDPNCVHEPASEYNIDPACRAAMFPNAQTNVAYYEGNIYYFTNTDIFSHKIYKMEIDGPGRTLIAEIPYCCEIPGGMVFYEDKMYYLITEKIRVGEMGDLESKTYLLEYDLKSNEYRIATPQIKYNVLGDAMQVTKDYIYMIHADGNKNGALFVMRYNRETTEAEVFIDTDEYETHRLIRAYDDYYVYCDELKKVGIRDISGSEDKVLIEYNGNGWIRVVASGNNILYEVKESLEDGTTQIEGIYFYNILTEETIDITEKALEFNIKKYDAYNKVFICNVVKNTSVINEEVVLGTKGDVSE